VRSSDLNDAVVVIAATSDEEANNNVFKWANKRKLLVNVVDQPHLSNFISPAVFRKKEAMVSVYEK